MKEALAERRSRSAEEPSLGVRTGFENYLRISADASTSGSRSGRPCVSASAYFHWYNHEHRHSGLGFHSGRHPLRPCRQRSTRACSRPPGGVRRSPRRFVASSSPVALARTRLDQQTHGGAADTVISPPLVSPPLTGSDTADELLAWIMVSTYLGGPKRRPGRKRL